MKINLGKVGWFKAFSTPLQKKLQNGVKNAVMRVMSFLFVYDCILYFILQFFFAPGLEML